MRRMRVTIPWILLASLACLGNAAQDHVYHEGVIELQGRETMIIEDVTYHQAGSIWLNGSSSLVVRNATLVFGQFEEHAWGPGLWGATQCVSARDESSILMENVEILMAPGEGDACIRVDAGGNSEVILKNVTMRESVAYGLDQGYLEVSGSVLGDLNVFHSSSVRVSSSHILGDLGLVVGGSTAGVLSDLHRGYIASWSSIGNAELENEPFLLEVTDTTIDLGWSVRPRDSAQLVIRDSEIVHMDLRITGPSGTISELRPGLYESWSLDEQGLESDINLVLKNVEVGDWRPLFYDCNSDVTLVDSEATNISLHGVSSTITLQGCLVGGFQISDFYGTLRLVDSVVTAGLQLDQCWLTLEGSFQFSEDSVVLWDESTIVRTFLVRAVDSAGAPIPGSHITAVGPGSGIYSAVTDEAGEVTLWVTFTGSGERDSMTISAEHEDRASAPVSVNAVSSDLVLIVLTND